MEGIQVIGFDADDTLWVNETYFLETEQKLRLLLAPYVDGETVSAELFRTESRNMPPVSYTHLPYSAISVYALHPMYISLPLMGELKDADRVAFYKAKQEELNAKDFVDYEAAVGYKLAYCRESVSYTHLVKTLLFCWKMTISRSMKVLIRIHPNPILFLLSLIHISSRTGGANRFLPNRTARLYKLWNLVSC